MGASLRLVGHGGRERTLLGATAPDDVGPRATTVWARRYRCLACCAILIVQPLGVAPGLAYSLIAIVTALGSWACGDSAAVARGKASAFPIVGDAAAGGWASLRRWVRMADRLLPTIPAFVEQTYRHKARRLIAFIAAFAPRTTGAVLTDALAGAVHAARGSWPM